MIPLFLYQLIQRLRPIKIKIRQWTNRNYVYEQLKPYFKQVVLPEGAFYLYLDASNYGLSSYEFAIELLKEQRVALVPSVAFEAQDSGYVRLSYCCDFEVLKEGIARIQNFRKSL